MEKKYYRCLIPPGTVFIWVLHRRGKCNILFRTPLETSCAINTIKYTNNNLKTIFGSLNSRSTGGDNELYLFFGVIKFSSIISFNFPWLGSRDWMLKYRSLVYFVTLSGYSILWSFVHYSKKKQRIYWVFSKLNGVKKVALKHCFSIISHLISVVVAWSSYIEKVKSFLVTNISDLSRLRKWVDLLDIIVTTKTAAYVYSFYFSTYAIKLNAL